MVLGAAQCALAHGSNEALAKSGVSESAHADGVLELDEAWFWDGETLDGKAANASVCGVTVNCPLYPLRIAAGGKRLRVGIDTPVRSNTFVVELIDPSGVMAASDSTSNQFNSEARVDNPAAGDWTVRVRPQDVSQASFRLRAKLETVLPEELLNAGSRHALLPNLRTVPPLEFTFTAPANPLNGLYPPDTANPPLSAAGVSPLSCTADEMAPQELGGGAAQHCLRFTSGPINLGPGIYDMRFRMLDDFVAGTAYLNPEEALSRVVVGPMEQAIHFSDGSLEFRPAGTYSFHPVHFHFHDDYVLSFELHTVTDTASGGLVRAGEGTKSGFCPADQLFGDWFSFLQGYEVPGGDTAGGNCFSPSDGVIGLSLGWGDVYRWQRPGMYVEFAGRSNGRYVVRALVDAANHVMETDETDNVSYAYVHIEGENIELLERGWGSDPWDPGKVVFDGAGPAQRSAPVSGAETGKENPTGKGLLIGAWTWSSLLPLLALALLLRWTRLWGPRHASRTEAYIVPRSHE
jgi:hypothetical protein